MNIRFFVLYLWLQITALSLSKSFKLYFVLVASFFEYLERQIIFSDLGILSAAAGINFPVVAKILALCFISFAAEMAASGS